MGKHLVAITGKKTDVMGSRHVVDVVAGVIARTRPVLESARFLMARLFGQLAGSLAPQWRHAMSAVPCAAPVSRTTSSGRYRGRGRLNMPGYRLRTDRS